MLILHTSQLFIITLNTVHYVVMLKQMKCQTYNNAISDQSNKQMLLCCFRYPFKAMEYPSKKYIVFPYRNVHYIRAAFGTSCVTKISSSSFNLTRDSTQHTSSGTCTHANITIINHICTGSNPNCTCITSAIICYSNPPSCTSSLGQRAYLLYIEALFVPMLYCCPLPKNAFFP